MLRLTRPCSDCPFRREGGIRLRAGRVRDIARSNVTFHCHKTVDYNVEEGDGAVVPSSQYCAGKMNFLLNVGDVGQALEVFARLGWWDPDAMRDREQCFDSLGEMLQAVD